MTETTSLSLSGPTAFIGGGNMARSLIGGLVARGHAPDAIRVADPAAAQREALERDFGVRTFEHATDAAEGAACWMLAVKPQVMRTVCESLAPLARTRPLVVSVAAGITTAQLQRWLGDAAGRLPVVRAMPNTPALLGVGVTGLFASAAVDAGQRGAATAVLETAGPAVWIDDLSLIHI